MAEQLSPEELAKRERDELCASMRLVGQLMAAHQLVEMINVPHQNHRVKDLVDAANSLLRKAMLVAWEAQCERQPSF